MCPLWFSQIVPVVVWSQSQNHWLKTGNWHLEAPNQFCRELWPPLQLDPTLSTCLDRNTWTQITSHHTHLIWDVNSVIRGQTFHSPAFVRWCRHCTKHAGMTIKHEYVGGEGRCTVCYTRNEYVYEEYVEYEKMGQDCYKCDYIRTNKWTPDYT